MLCLRLKNIVNRLLDAKVNNLVAVIREDDVERGISFEGFRQLGFQTDLFAVDNVILQTLFNRSTFRSFLGCLGFDVLEQRREPRQRIISADVSVKLLPVIDQVTSYFQLFCADSIQRLNLAGVDDSCIETRFYCVVQEYRVQYYPGFWVEDNRNVGNLDDGERAEEM